MGIRAHLTVITAAALQEITEGGNPSLDGGQKYYLEKSWIDFQAIFSEQEPPLDKTIVGDAKHPEATHSIEMVSHDYYCGFVSVTLTQAITAKLNSIEDEQLVRLYAAANLPYHKSVDWYFNQLKSAYSDAASGSNALMILVS